MEKITEFLKTNWFWATLIFGIVLVLGAILNWNWLCNPTGKPDSHRYGRGARRFIFGSLGVVLIGVSIWSIVLAFD